MFFREIGMNIHRIIIKDSKQWFTDGECTHKVWPLHTCTGIQVMITSYHEYRLHH